MPCLFECVDGYVGVGSHVCSTTGQFTGGSCVESRSECEPISTLFGDEHHVVQMTCHTAIGSQCLVMCEPGYHRRGTGAFVCQEGGQWSGSLRCEPAELEPEPAPLHTIPLSQKKKSLLRTPSNISRNKYACLKKTHFNSSSTSASSPTNPDINRFLVRQRSITEPGIENVAVDVTEEAHASWLVQMGREYETVLDSRPVQCVRCICNLVLTGGFVFLVICCVVALFSLSYLYDHKDSKRNFLCRLITIFFSPFEHIFNQ